MVCSTPELCSNYATACEACYNVTVIQGGRRFGKTASLEPEPAPKPKQPKLNRHERRERKRAASK